MKYIKLCALILGMLLITAVPLLAQDGFTSIELDNINGPAVPVFPGGYTIVPGSIGEGAASDFAPAPDACNHAAGSYLSPGIEAARSLLITFDEIVHDNQDEELVYFALYAIEANAPGWVDNIAEGNGLEAAAITDDDIVTISSENICINANGLTVRLWQLEEGGWAVETVSFNDALDITSSWPDDMQNPQQGGQLIAAPELPVLVSGLVVRYLLPHVEQPIVTVPGANEIGTNIPTTVCEGTPPSYLGIGMDVILRGHGYEQVPLNFDVSWTEWELDETPFGLSNYGEQVYQDILQTTPLTGIVGNLESVMLSPAELLDGITIGTVVDGPFCTSINAEPATSSGNVMEAPDPDLDRFYTWWQIEVKGETGWYPENVGQYAHWLWSTENIFPRKLSLYYMIPVAQSMAGDACDSLPASPFIAGTEVQPALERVNRRAEPNGDVIGVLDLGQTTFIYGDPVCEGNTRWWQSSAGGWVAENVPNTAVALLLPAVQKAVETEEPAATADPNPPRPVEVQPTPTPATSNVEPPCNPTRQRCS